MTSHSNYTRKVLLTCCGTALALGLLVGRAQADPWDKKTTLTIDKTIQITDTVLPAGSYVLKLASSDSNRHIVQIFDKDQRHLINTILAIPNYRLRPTGRSQFMFWETPAGYTPALRAWFYPGDNFGQEFPYPKQLAMMQTTQVTERSRMMKQESETRTETQTTTNEQEADRVVESEAAPAPAPETQAEVQSEERVEMAQNTPPPAPTAPPEPAPQSSTAYRELPKTASPYPWIGLFGMFSLSLYSALRLKRRRA